MPPEFGSPFPTNSPVDRAVKIQYYLLSLPKNVRARAKAQIHSTTRGSAEFLKPSGRYSHVLLSTGKPVLTCDSRELRLLCEGLRHGNQPGSSVGTTLKACPSPQPSDIDDFLSKNRKASVPSFITVLLSQCVPSQQNCSHESVGKGNLGCEHLNSFNFLIWIMAYVSERRGRCRLPAAAAIIYNHHLGPFSITTTLMRTQGHLHLCQNTSGKSFTASNFLVRCALHLLILSVYVRRKKKSSCDFVKVWKEEMPA